MLFGAMNFPVRPVIDEIHSIGALGFDYVELAMDPPGAHYALLREQHHEIRATLDRYGLDLICHLPTFIHTADLTASIRRASIEELQHSLTVAHELGARKTVLHPSFVGGMGRSAPELARQYANECLEKMARLAEQNNRPICLENLFERLTPFTSPDEFDAVFQKWPHLQMTFDVGHAFIDGRGMDRILEFIRRFGQKILHVHISDNFGHRDDHLPVGEGEIDFRTLIAELKQIQYDLTMTLEVFTQDKNDLIRSRRRLEKMIVND